MTDRYDDIIGLSHHESATRKRMPISDRAAQFSPFAALNGHEEAISEVARQTVAKPELSDDKLRELSERLQFAIESENRPQLEIKYFEPDPIKPGGGIIEARGSVAKIDEYTRTLILDNGLNIPLDAVCEITGDCFDEI